MNSSENQKKVNISVMTSEPTDNGKPATKSRCHINREMLPIKLHYFLLISAMGVCLPFLVVFAKNRIGVSTTSLAVVLTVQRCLFVVTKPLICYIADYFNKLKTIILAITVLQAVFFISLLAIPKINTMSNHTALSLDGPEICDLYDKCNPLNLKQYPLQEDDEQSTIMMKMKEVCLFSKNYSDAVLEPFKLLQSVVSKAHKSSNTTSNNEDEDEQHLLSLLETKYTFFQCEQTVDRSCTFLTSKCFLCCHADSNCSVFSCETKYYSTAGTEPEDRESVQDFQTYTFWSFAVLFTIAYVFQNSLTALSDTACCETVNQHGSEYGRQRIYGTLGWGVASVIGGLLNDYTGDFVASWTLMAFYTVLALINIKRMKMAKLQCSSNILKDVGKVLASKEYLAFAFNVMMCGMGTGVVWFYLIWFLTTMGGSMFLCGLCNVVQCYAGEIPVMFFSGWIIKKLGHFNVMTLTLISYSIRFVWYSYLHNPWLVLPVEILHGITFGLFYPALVSYAKLNAKPGTEATSQAVLNTVHEGLGIGLGCIVTGIAIDHIGPHQAFFFASVFAACGAVISVVLHLLIRRHKQTITETT